MSNRRVHEGLFGDDFTQQPATGVGDCNNRVYTWWLGFNDLSLTSFAGGLALMIYLSPPSRSARRP